ncbi:hypothetical protein V5799_002936 [Amblyomma americanum]|uniref:Uncharacterized protein n=1 Tax=Amblyomma americanum TaxID=6943 RepID=A0AAQ4DAE6_AMBAM
MADDGAGDFVRDVFHALAVNTAITEIVIHLDKIDRLDTATAFSYMLSRNTTATNISLWFSTTFPRQFIREISRGMTLNKLVVDLKFVTEKLCCDPSSLVVFEALRRNRAALNRAVDFVLRRPADRRCAESFELFAGRSCLLARLVEVTGKTEPEVSLDLTAAEHFLQDHYLILTGIIQRTLVCRPAQATQLDELNTDCWRAVVRHLKIGDVRLGRRKERTKEEEFRKARAARVSSSDRFSRHRRPWPFLLAFSPTFTAKVHHPAMRSGDKQGSAEFSVSSIGMSVPQLVQGSDLKRAEGASGFNHDVNCGLLGVYPSFLQSYRTPRCYLFFLCILGMTQGFVVNGLVSVVTPTIEKRFQLLGIEVGVIQGMFNVASCIMVTSGSYHGGVGHRPVIPGIGTLVTPVGAMIFASPHFIAPQYRVLENGTANIGPERGPGKCSLSGRATNANTFKYFFMSRSGELPLVEIRCRLKAHAMSVCVSLAAAKLKAIEVAQKQKQQSKQSRGTPDAQELKAAEAPEAGDDAKEHKGAPSPQQEAPEPKDVHSPQTNAGSGQTPEVAERSFVNHVRRLVCNPTFVCLTLAAAAESLTWIALFGALSASSPKLIIVNILDPCTKVNHGTTAGYTYK